MIRTLDFLFSLIGLLALSPVIFVVAVLGFLDTGSPLFIQTRVGKNQKPFQLLKFRTMNIGTVSVATHLADSSTITALGNFLRKTKLDELPQLWNVLVGDMSLVGPRPCLVTQTELIEERERMGVFAVKPGITGLAQVSGIDMSTPALLAKTDREMIQNFNLVTYFEFIILTFSRTALKDRVRH